MTDLELLAEVMKENEEIIDLYLLKMHYLSAIFRKICTILVQLYFLCKQNHQRIAYGNPWRVTRISLSLQRICGNLGKKSVTESTPLSSKQLIIRQMCRPIYRHFLQYDS